MNIQMQAIIAGVFFGLWPLLMNRSGLSGNVSAAVFSSLAFLFVLPFALKSGALANANWAMAIGAGVLGGLGLLSFNGMLAKATPHDVGLLFILMILAQTAVPAIYQAIISGLSFTKAAGLLAAFIAAVLLTKQ